MIRYIFVLTLFLITHFTSFSQNDNEIKTLSSSKNFSSGGYGGFSVGYTRVDDNNAIIFGGKGAWIINHYMGIGGALYGYNHLNFHNDFELVSGKGGGYMGLLLEPVILAKNIVNLSFPFIIGGGTYIRYINDNFVHNEYFIFVPGIELQFNVTPHYRMALGFDYRLTSNADVTTAPRGFSIHLVFKFGKF